LFYKKTLTALQSAGIVTLADLLLHTPKQIAILPRDRVEWYHQRIKTLLLSGTVRLDTSSPERFVRSMLHVPFTLSKNQEQKIEYTFLKLRGHTLEEISKRYGKSRERIRQCVENTRTIAFLGFNAGRDVLTNVLSSLGGCGTLESVRSKLMETFNWSDQECTEEFVSALLRDIVRDGFVKIGESLYITPDFPCITCPRFDVVVARIMKNYPSTWSHEGVCDLIIQELPQSAQCSRCLKGRAVPIAWIQHKLSPGSPLWKRLQKLRDRHIGVQTAIERPSMTKKGYPVHVKQEAIRLIFEEKYADDWVAAQIGCSIHTILSWKKQYRKRKNKSLAQKKKTELAVSLQSPEQKNTVAKLPPAFDEFVRNFWNGGTRAVDVLILPPEVSPYVICCVNDALLYAYEKLH
jgi:transposase-like protein